MRPEIIAGLGYFGNRRGRETTHLLEVLQELSIDEVARTLVQRAVDGDDVTLRNQILEVRDTAGVDSLGGIYAHN